MARDIVFQPNYADHSVSKIHKLSLCVEISVLLLFVLENGYDSDGRITLILEEAWGIHLRLSLNTVIGSIY